MTTLPFPALPGTRSRSRRRGTRPPLTAAERRAVAAVGGLTAAFAASGYARHQPSTTGYVVVVVALSTALAAVRRQRPLPAWMAAAAPVLVAGHFAGGLTHVGHAVLYNAHPHLHALQYDHLFHASASAFAVAVLWWVAEPYVEQRWVALTLAALGACGIGALNELVEFLATLAHHGSHVGGYVNTGWDLVANAVGTAVATAALARSRTPDAERPPRRAAEERATCRPGAASAWPSASSCASSCACACGAS